MRNLSESCSFLKMRSKAKLNSPLGTFDTITRTIETDKYYLDNLTDAVDSWLHYCTFFHEQMHYYQFASSSLGLFFTCLMDMEYEIIAPLVQELDFIPPFINCVENQADEFNKRLHSLREMLGYKKEQAQSFDYVQKLLDEISDIELFLFVLEGGFPPEQLEQVTKGRPLRTSLMNKIYYYVSRLYDHTGKDLNAFYDSMKKKYSPKKSKLANCNEIMLMSAPNGLAFGYNMILESQARYCELTRLLSYMGRFNEPENLVKVRQELLKKDDYQIAHNIFASVVTHLSKEMTPIHVFLFCLVCDYAIHIPIPQTPQLGDSFLALYDFNLIMPGPRFISICSALNRALKDGSDISAKEWDWGKVQFLELKTLDEWNRLIYILYDVISKDTGYPSPISIANAFIENNYTFDAWRMDFFPVDYDNAVFLEACKTRIKYPLFFINPELFRLIDRKKYIEISNSQGPPAMKVKKGLISFSKRKNHEMQQGYLVKRVLSKYLSGLFFGYEANMDPKKYFGVSIQDVEMVIKDRYGKIKRFYEKY